MIELAYNQIDRQEIIDNRQETRDKRQGITYKKKREKQSRQRTTELIDKASYTKIQGVPCLIDKASYTKNTG